MESSKQAYVIFGAGGGIGSALARFLLDEGHRVVLAGRRRASLENVQDGRDGLICEVDATRFDAVAGCMQQAAEWAGTLHGVVNCVGSVLLKPAHLTPQEQFEAVIATNLTSAFAVVRAAAPLLRRGGGSIVLFSSAAARIGLGNHEAIAAAKAGVCGLTLSAAATYAAHGVRVNAIAPGLVDTPLTARIVGNENALQSSVAMHPLGRIGQPADIVPLASWLLSPASSWITGQTISADGGLAGLKTRMVPKD